MTELQKIDCEMHLLESEIKRDRFLFKTVVPSIKVGLRANRIEHGCVCSFKIGRTNICDEERHVWPAIISLYIFYMFVCPFLNEGTHITFFLLISPVGIFGP